MFTFILNLPNLFNWILPELDIITPEYEEKAYLSLMYQVPELAIDESPQQENINNLCDN